MSANRRVGVEIFASGAQAKGEFAATKAEIAGIKAEAQTAGPTASAAMNGIGTSARSTAAALGTASTALATSTTKIAILEQKSRDLNAEIGRLSRSLIEQANSAKEAAAAGNVPQYERYAAQVRQTTQQLNSLTLQQDETSKAIRTEEALIQSSTSSWARKTTMINTGQGALRGYDAALTGVIRSMGGINLGWAVAISLGASLLPVLLNLVSAKEEQIKVDKDQLALDLQRADIANRVLRTNADLIGSFRVIAATQTDYQKKTDSLNQAITALSTQGFEGHIVANAKTGVAQAQVIRTTSELQQKVGELNTKLGEHEKTLGPALELIREYQTATHKSTDEVLEWARTVGHFAPEQIEFFRDQLTRTIPVVDELTKALDKLREPKFELGPTPQGIANLQDAVLKGLQDTFDKGIGGSSNQVNSFDAQVRAIAPTLQALDDALKRNAGSSAEYRRQIQDLNPVVKAALELHQKQIETFKEEFKAREKIKDLGPELELESLRAAIALEKDNFQLKRDLVIKEFAFRRAQMEENGQATQLNLLLLKAIEIRALTEVTNQHLEHYRKLDDERRKNLERQREFREREQNEFRLHLVKQRQIREEEEKRFLADQAKAERALRSDRPGRREVESEEIRRQAEELRRVQRVFGDLNRESATFELHLKAIDAFSGQQSFLAGLKNSLNGVINTFDLAQAAGFAFADALQIAFDQAINEGANFAEVFGKTILAGILSAIGQQAIAEGTYHILAGIAKLFNPFTAAAGAKEIAAGAALVAFGSALVAGASAITSSIGNKNNAASGAGSAASGGGGSPASGSTQREPRPPVNVVVPSPERQRPVVVNFDSEKTADLVMHMFTSRGGVTVRSAREEHNVTLRKSLKTSG